MESYPSAEMQSVYSTAPANWARSLLGMKVLMVCIQGTSPMVSLLMYVEFCMIA